MKSVLISIRPEWVAKILNGEKTIEVRKTYPSTEEEFKVYIYCTKKGNDICKMFGAPYDDVVVMCTSEEINGKVVAEFTCDTVGFISNIDYEDGQLEELLKGTALTPKEVEDYMGYGIGCYKWYIKNLKIYDEPKQLSDFNLKRAPQSWCYVDDLNNE